MKSKTERLAGDGAGVARAADLLRDGRLVAFPTETVYGLGANACNGEAVARIFEAKNRPSFNPLILHVPDLEAAQRVGELGPEALRLAEAFWPGALTLVVPLKPEAGVSDLATAGNRTVGIRVPYHPLALELLAAADSPVAAPSANPSGCISPTRPDHVLSEMSGRIDAVLDGGPCHVGLESTIVSVFDVPTLLRPGGIPAEAVEACLGNLLHQADPADGIQSPGQLASHYAPASPIRLNVSEPRNDELYLGFGPMTADLNLSPSGDLREAAANLFAHLRDLDARGGSIAVAPVPVTGLGLAINDRLSRAAAPKP